MNPIKILVLDCGHVRVAEVQSPHPDKAFHYRLPVSRCIRRWGTTAGLAQLAAEGPQTETVLDAVYSGDVPWRAVIEILDVSPEAEVLWRRALEREPSATRRRR